MVITRDVIVVKIKQNVAKNKLLQKRSNRLLSLNQLQHNKEILKCNNFKIRSRKKGADFKIEKRPSYNGLFSYVDISENEWNQLIDYVIQWHLVVKEEFVRVNNRGNNKHSISNAS